MNRKPYVVGVAGSSGSGKTYFLNSFLAHFKPEEVSLISQDDYYFPAPPMTQEENKLYNFDLPATIDRKSFSHDILQLMQGHTILKRKYTFNNPSLQPKMLELRPAPLLLIEGLFIFHFEEINQLIDQRIFIEASEEVALKRRIKRDLTERGYGEDDVRYKWENHVMPAYHTYLIPYKSTCNLIVENNTNLKADMLTVTQEISDLLRARVFV
ncbi:uridine kinase [bacterium A37T11]|nr:uridine kinase [bacterium A37T11]